MIFSFIVDTGEGQGPWKRTTRLRKVYREKISDGYEYVCYVTAYNAESLNNVLGLRGGEEGVGCALLGNLSI